MCRPALFLVFFYWTGRPQDLHVLTHSFPPRRSSDLSLKLATPAHRVVERPELPAQAESRADEGARFQAALTAVGASADFVVIDAPGTDRSEEPTSELQSLMRLSYAVFCLKKKKKETSTTTSNS